MQYILYFLIFIFGYVTCKTFYFLRATRISLSLIKLSHLIYLSAMQKIIEEWLTYVDDLGMTGSDRFHLMNALDEEIEHLKTRSVDYLLKLHPQFYREALSFGDWESAMNYIDQNKEVIVEFWQGRDND
jgi:hypothetical protein